MIYSRIDRLSEFSRGLLAKSVFLMVVTIQHIAERVGVSKQAVSYALNGKVGQVSEDTRRRIQAVADSLGYQPNWRARSFARKRSRIIGLVYGRPADYVEGSRIVSGLVERLAALDYELLLIPATGPVENWAHKLRDGRVDAVLITHPIPLGLDDFVSLHALPAVFLNLRSDADLPQISFDDVAGTTLAMQHLLGLGHRRIAYFCPPQHHGEHYSNVDRRQTYRDCMRNAGLSDLIHEQYSGYEVYATQIAAARPAERPTAVLAYNDFSAARLMRALWTRHVRVPDQLSVVGFDDTPMGREITPPLTTVALSAEALVEASVSRLMPQIEAGHRLSDIERVCLPERLIVRDSTAAPTAENDA
jgi:DNA-binding LacI/PurR family transcriptional regulator